MNTQTIITQITEKAQKQATSLRNYISNSESAFLELKDDFQQGLIEDYVELGDLDLDIVNQAMDDLAETLADLGKINKLIEKYNK